MQIALGHRRPNLYAGCAAGATALDGLQHTLAEFGVDDARIQPRDRAHKLIREWTPGRGWRTTLALPESKRGTRTGDSAPGRPLAGRTPMSGIADPKQDVRNRELAEGKLRTTAEERETGVLPRSTLALAQGRLDARSFGAVSARSEKQ